VRAHLRLFAPFELAAALRSAWSRRSPSAAASRTAIVAATTAGTRTTTIGTRISAAVRAEEIAMTEPSFDNALGRTIARFDVLPAAVRKAVVSTVLGRAVRFAGTAGVQFEELSRERVVTRIKNRGPVQNHIKGVHAAAMALLVETATGFVVGLNVPDDRLPLIKTMKVDYVARATGGLRAEATLTPAQIEQIRTQPKGDVAVGVRVTDDAGAEPIRCEMVWAWIPKKKG
jgi:acyl-coenzyme A thioesterase PaaI-like protein